MEITYYFADGTTSKVEVDEELGSVIRRFDRDEENSTDYHHYHCYSLDALEATDRMEEFGQWDEYTLGNEAEELSARIKSALSHLTEIQRKRLFLFSKGMSIHKIAEKENVSYFTVYRSIESARKKFLKNF